MLDRKFVLENAEAVKANCKNRGTPEEIDRVVALETQRRARLAEAEELNRQANAISAQIGKVPPNNATSSKNKEGNCEPAKMQCNMNTIPSMNKSMRSCPAYRI